MVGTIASSCKHLTRCTPQFPPQVCNDLLTIRPSYIALLVLEDIPAFAYKSALWQISGSFNRPFGIDTIVSDKYTFGK
ncbi:MAG: hypothetical protein DMG88_02415 [Acidobacteria bacterium]|nr:MAG: hypothetical protein DMG88_02415 [Acidobacteriota bacterium]